MKIQRRLFLLLLPAVALACMAMAKKPIISVRFHVEGNPNETAPFVTGVKFHNPERDGVIQTVPFASERDIAAIFPFQAPDGSMGCSFKLQRIGRDNLELVSSANQNKSLVVFVGTKQGSHQVIDMVIDKRVSDGIITVQRGLTPLEIAIFSKEYRVLGQEAAEKKVKESKKKEKRSETAD